MSTVRHFYVKDDDQAPWDDLLVEGILLAESGENTDLHVWVLVDDEEDD